LSTAAVGGEPDDRVENRVLALSRGRGEGNPRAESRSVELVKPSRPFAAAELVDLGGDGGDADRPRARELDEHSLFVFGGTAHVEHQDEPAEQRPFGEVALDGSGESLAIALGGAREAIAGKIHEGEAGAEIGKEMDPPRAPGSLAHSREAAPLGDTIQ